MASLYKHKITYFSGLLETDMGRGRDIMYLPLNVKIPDSSTINRFQVCVKMPVLRWGEKHLAGSQAHSAVDTSTSILYFNLLYKLVMKPYQRSLYKPMAI